MENFKIATHANNKTKRENGEAGEANGYVVIPRDHPLAGCSWEFIQDESNIEVFGGVSYSEVISPKTIEAIKGLTEDDLDSWLIGFDTCHAVDDDDYSMWDIKGVLKEAESLKNQLQAVYEEVEEKSKEEPGSIEWIKGSSNKEFIMFKIQPFELKPKELLMYMERVTAIAEGRERRWKPATKKGYYRRHKALN